MSEEAKRWETVDPADMAVGEALERLSYQVRDYDGDLRAAFWIPGDAERYVRDRNRESGVGETGDAHAEVREAMRGRLADIADLLRLVHGPDEYSVTDERCAELGVDGSEYVGDQAEERLAEYPLSVESTVQFEIVLGTGGPDDRIVVECERVDGNGPEPEAPATYEIRRVLYRYSWTGSAEVELTGEDREAAEEFARRVVPELVE